MKMSQPGFSLIEFTVYFFLIIQLTVMVTSYMVSNYATITGYNKISDIDINLSCTVDVLERDIKQFCSTQGTLLHKADNEYIWVDGFSVGWEVYKGNVIRTEGLYDPLTYQWHESVRGTVVNNIKAIHITPYYEGSIMRSIVCTVESNNSNNILTRTVAIRNKKIK
ncbi:MAG TPA: hypothetical protein VGT41_06345 [Candidatus Babeliales bacterium]|nr:hypothetical protein [Candidatus Babeliales bacterium]